MPSLTLKGIPNDLLEQLRSLAEKERRSLNQQAIMLLESALEQKRPSYTEAYGTFLRKYGPSPIGVESFDDAFEGLRSREIGRPAPFEQDETGG